MSATEWDILIVLLWLFGGVPLALLPWIYAPTPQAERVPLTDLRLSEFSPDREAALRTCVPCCTIRDCWFEPTEGQR